MKKLLLFATLLIVNYSLNAMTSANGTKTRILKADDNHLTVCWEIDSENEKCIFFNSAVLKSLIDSLHPAKKSEGTTCIWHFLHENAKPQLKSSNENKKELSQEEAKQLFS